MNNKFNSSIDKSKIFRRGLGIGGVTLIATSVFVYGISKEKQISDTELTKIEQSLGSLSVYDSDLDLIKNLPKTPNGAEAKSSDDEIKKINHDLSPIISINIANIIKDKHVEYYDWESNIDKNRIVTYDPGNNFKDIFVSVENFDKEGDGVIDETRGRLGMKDGELVGTVFGFGHTNSSPEDDAIMDKIDEVRVGDTVKISTKDGVKYVFTIDDIKLATKTDPDDKAKLCGSAGRIFTCFVDNNSRTNRSTYLCLTFKGIEKDDRTILAAKN